MPPHPNRRKSSSLSLYLSVDRHVPIAALLPNTHRLQPVEPRSAAGGSGPFQRGRRFRADPDEQCRLDGIRSAAVLRAAARAVGIRRPAEAHGATIGPLLYGRTDSTDGTAGGEDCTF